MRSSNRIIYNTTITYVKSIITILISLYTTRLVLEALGAKDFGLFNVVGGIITLLAFLNSAMATSTQRYLSFNLGFGDLLSLNRIFTNSVILHFIIGFLLILIFEILGYYFVNYKLIIDHDRLYAANLLLQFVIISTFFAVVSVPYDAVINAHENMLFLAVVGVLEVFLRLGVAIYITYYENDKLILYGFLMMFIAIFLRVIKQFYVRFKYKKVHFNFFEFYDKKLMIELTSYAGWNMFGALSIVAKNEGLAILFNLFFGTLINAAFAVANQVSAQVLFFSRTLMQAINPQIVKSEGAGNRNKMLQISFSACKFSFMLVAFIGIPSIFEMSAILNFWLKNVPDFSVIFCQLIIFSILINQLTIGLQTAIQATGTIRKYQILVGTVQLLNVPFFYLLFKIGLPPYVAMICYSFFEIIACTLRVIILKELTSISIRDFVNKVIFSQIIPVLLSAIVCIIIMLLFEFKFRFIFTVIISSLMYFISIYFFSLNVYEKNIIIAFVKKIKTSAENKL